MKENENPVALLSVKPYDDRTHVAFDVSIHDDEDAFFEGGTITVIIPGDVSERSLDDIAAMGRLRLKIALEKLNDLL